MNLLFALAFAVHMIINGGCSGIRSTQPGPRQGAVPSAGSPMSNVETPVIPLVPRATRGHPAPLRIPQGVAESSDVHYSHENCPADQDLRGLLERVLRSEGAPTELAALVWVETRYSVGGYSSAGAAGPWQFMSGTARFCNLRMADRVDERYSWVASTRAASRYLGYLHGMFGDWKLAIAAYNCGEGTLQRALSGGRTTFGELSLPRETSYFVPRFARALEAYNQLDPTGDGLSVILVPPGIDLRLLAAETGVSPGVLAELNRGYLAETVPASGDRWEVVIPTEFASVAFQTAWIIDPTHYLVKYGDTWDCIAATTGVDRQRLLDANSGTDLVAGAILSLPESSRTPVNTRAAESSGFFRYTVRSGDTLGGIGSMVGVSSREVAQWNGISTGTTIHPGQTLMLRGTPPAASSGGGFEMVTGGGRLTHTVVSGDTIWDLSRNYGVSVEQIQRLNNRTDSSLSIGEVLIIRPE